jgi:hypothetical protein
LKKILFILSIIIAVNKPVQARNIYKAFDTCLHAQPINSIVGEMDMLYSPEYSFPVPVWIFYYNENYKRYKGIKFIKPIYKPP